MKRLSPMARIVFFALLVGVVIPYLSYKLRMMDRCMPEEAGMFYLPVIVPLIERCPISFVSELGLVTVGLPATVAGFVFAIDLSTNRILSSLPGDLFCIAPLLFSFITYSAIVLIVRWIVKRIDNC